MDGTERRILLRSAATEELVAQYERAARVLRSLIAGAVRRGALGTATQRRRQLAAVERALGDLSSATRGLAAVSIAGGYQLGATSADASAREALPSAVVEPLLEPAFASGANRGTVRALQLSTERKLDGALTQVGRSVEDVFRRVALEEVGTGAAAGLGRRETSSRIADRLAGEGIAAFTDRAGRRWKLDTYSRMVARTTQREAASLGVADRMGQVGLDLVRISDHDTTTPICKPYEGNVFSLTGRTRGYKKLDRPPPFHPNCEHVMGAAAENLSLALEALAAAA